MTKTPAQPIANLARRFARLSNRNRGLAAEAVMWLAASRMALVFLPFNSIAARLGTFSAPGHAAPNPTELSPEQLHIAHEIGWAVTRAARYVPFRAVCLPQAIAAKMMLRRRHVASALHFGVAIAAGEPLKAHAWLDADGVEVTGFPIAAEFVETARFD
jgi:hypothetical protein